MSQDVINGCHRRFRLKLCCLVNILKDRLKECFEVRLSSSSERVRHAFINLRGDNVHSAFDAAHRCLDVVHSYADFFDLREGIADVVCRLSSIIVVENVSLY